MVITDETKELLINFLSDRMGYNDIEIIDVDFIDGSDVLISFTCSDNNYMEKEETTTVLDLLSYAYNN